MLEIEVRNARDNGDFVCMYAILLLRLVSMFKHILA